MLLRDKYRRLATRMDGRSRNLRIFVLLAAMAAFGALWSSDEGYQAEQLAIVRAERARTANIAVVTRLGGQAMVPKVDQTTLPALQNASDLVPSQCVLTLRSLLAAERTQISPCRPVNETVAPLSLERLAVTAILGVDPGEGVGRLTTGIGGLRTQLEERFCLLRFRTRQAAYFGSRRLVNLLHAMSTGPAANDGGRIVIREMPIEATQAPARGSQPR